MQPSVVFLHGAGDRAYAVDRPLVASLRAVLGPTYRIIYPQMLAPDSPRYDAWRAQLTATFAAPDGPLVDGPLIAVGHSLGGSVLVKYLSEEPVERHIAGLFLLAAPYWGSADWQVEEYRLRADFAARLPADMPIFCYHSRDDAVVPFAHLAHYAAHLPWATIRACDGRGHQFANDLADVAADIAALAPRDQNG